MSARFASITASLLARKGEAQPWMPEAVKEPLLFRSEPVAAVAPPQRPSPPPPPQKERSCSVRMSAQDYERLGILAVKTGSTRQQLMKQALAELMAAKARHLSCACLGACERGCG